MNDLQKTELKMLEEIVKICQNLNLRYYLICGSALGAVKYKGFIPWDDDIDIALPRADYNTLIDQVPKYLPEYYFLQNYKTDKSFPFLCSKLRNSRTTYIEKTVDHLNINHGVFIDIIPLDLCDAEDKKMYAKLHRTEKICYIFLKSKENYKNVAKMVLRKVVNKNKYIFSFEMFLSSRDDANYDYYCNLHNSKNGKICFPKDVYGRGLAAEFEGLNVVVPEKYDEYLTSYYGDWRAELPEDEKISHHFYTICDLDKPYTNYAGSCASRKAIIKESANA